MQRSWWFEVAWLVALALLLTVLGAWLAPGRGAFPYDPNAFVGGAKALAEGKGYRLTAFVGEPVMGIYPAGHSLFLSLGWKPGATFDANVARMLWLQRGASVAALVLAGCLLLRGGVTRPLCALAMVHLGLSLSWAWTTQTLMSDIPCHAWVFGALLPWVGAGAGEWRRPARVWAWTGLALGMACLWRTAALPFVGMLGLLAGVAAWVGRHPAPLAAAVGLVPMAVWRWLSHGGITYRDNFEQWGPVLGGAEGMQATLIRKFWVLVSGEFVGFTVSGMLGTGMGAAARRAGLDPGISSWILRGFGLGLVLLAVAGLLRHRGPVRWGLAIVVCGYVGSVWLAPIELSLFLSERYLVPIVPLLLVWAWQGLEGFNPSLRRPLPAAAAWLLTAVSVCMGVALIAAHPRDWGMRLRDGYRDAAAWIRSRGEAGPVAVGAQAPVVDFHEASGRKLVTDYLDAPLLPYMPLFLLHRDQGHAAARYVVMERGDPRLERKDLPVRPVHTSSNGVVTVLEVDPEREAAWRRARGVPAPR